MLPSSGGVVFIKEGTYTITSSLVPNVDNTTIMGVGRGTIITSASAITLITATSLTGVEVRSIQFVGGGVVDDAISFTSCVECMVVGCWFDGLDGNAISTATSLVRSIIAHNIITDSAAAGMDLDSIDNSVITNNIIHNTTNHGIVLNQADQNVINDNEIYDNSGVSMSGILITLSNDNMIQGNNIEGNGDRGIWIADATSNRNIVIGNSLRNNTTAGLTDSGTDTQIGHNIET